MEKDYSKNIVKEYTHWTVYVHENQGYLGRCVIWCKRDGAFDLTDAIDDERNELHIILKDLRAASIKCFNPDWFNYVFLGNETRHLHCHLVPRYATPRIFMETKFGDALYGHNFQIDHRFITPENILQAIKSQMIKTLDQDATT